MVAACFEAITVDITLSAVFAVNGGRHARFFSSAVNVGDAVGSRCNADGFTRLLDFGGAVNDTFAVGWTVNLHAVAGFVMTACDLTRLAIGTVDDG